MMSLLCDLTGLETRLTVVDADDELVGLDCVVVTLARHHLPPSPGWSTAIGPESRDTGISLVQIMVRDQEISSSLKP